MAKRMCIQINHGSRNIKMNECKTRWSYEARSVVGNNVLGVSVRRERRGDQVRENIMCDITGKRDRQINQYNTRSPEQGKMMHH